MTIHLQILSGDITDADYADFILVLDDGITDMIDPEKETLKLEKPDWMDNEKQWGKFQLIKSKSNLQKIPESFQVNLKTRFV